MVEKNIKKEVVKIYRLRFHRSFLSFSEFLAKIKLQLHFALALSRNQVILCLRVKMPWSQYRKYYEKCCRDFKYMPYRRALPSRRMPWSGVPLYKEMMRKLLRYASLTISVFGLFTECQATCGLPFFLTTDERQ